MENSKFEGLKDDLKSVALEDRLELIVLPNGVEIDTYECDSGNGDIA